MDQTAPSSRPPRWRSTGALGGAALLLVLPLLAAGCAESAVAEPGPGDPPADEPLTLGVITDGDGKSAVVVDPDKSANDVEDPETMTSTLDVGEGACYYITRGGGPPSTLLVFPPDTTLEGGDTPSVIVDGERFPDGTLIQVTGEDIQLSPDNLDQAGPCSGTAGAFFVTSAKGNQEPDPSESSSS